MAAVNVLHKVKNPKLDQERGRGQETKGVAVRPLRFTLAQAVLVREGAERGGADGGSSASSGGSCVRRC